MPLRKFILVVVLSASALPGSGSSPGAAASREWHVISIEGTRFLADGSPFPYTGVSFFNAIYNPEFNRYPETRRAWLAKFREHGVNVLRARKPGGHVTYHHEVFKFLAPRERYMNPDSTPASPS